MNLTHKRIFIPSKYIHIQNEGMTRLGEYLQKRSTNRAEVSRKTGIRTTRLHELSNNESANVKADELYLIALAVEANPADLFEVVCGHLELK